MDPSIKHVTAKDKPKRKIKVGTAEIEVRVVEPSKEAVKALNGRTFRTIVGHLAINPPHLDRLHANEKAKIMRNMALMNIRERSAYIGKGPIDFIKDKQELGYKKYNVFCTTCGDKVGYCWAKDDTLKEWCDFHYVCKHDKKMWYGCLAANVSPIDGSLGFECACGEDTRDFRASKTLPPIQKQLMSEYSTKHRGFAHGNAKFYAERSLNG